MGVLRVWFADLPCSSSRDKLSLETYGPADSYSNKFLFCHIWFQRSKFSSAPRVQSVILIINLNFHVVLSFSNFQMWVYIQKRTVYCRNLIRVIVNFEMHCTWNFANLIILLLKIRISGFIVLFWLYCKIVLKLYWPGWGLLAPKRFFWTKFILLAGIFKILFILYLTFCFWCLWKHLVYKC